MNPARWIAVSIAACGFATGAAHAQGYPAKPVRLVLPYSPGGSYDVLARILAQSLGERLGQQFIVENRPGAAGRIGTEALVKSPPDGYAIGLLGNNLTIAPHVYRQVPYDIERDLAPIGMVAIIAQMLVVHPSLPVKSVAELVALARARPGQLAFASGGTGGMTHLSGELLKSMARVNVVHVPYKGSAPAMIDLIAGQTQWMVLNLLNALPNTRSGKLKGLAVTSLERSRFAPQVPSLSESGLKGYEIVEWYGTAAPAKTSQAIVMRLHAEIGRIAGTEEFRGKLAQLAAEVKLGTPSDLAAYMKTDSARNARIVREAGIKSE
ncbi:MAG: tripartite tricarboxylate transporter substrate binding protein [Burkholderiales bacterium]|nr:tripartite tricarboxylate transporter substrate binding protein [Burkholderiales bacterium]